MANQKRIFGISSDNTGLMCPFQPIVCSEGYCRDCQIYLDWQKRGEIMLICAWCGKELGRKPNPSERPVVSHGICPECTQKHFPAGD